MAHPKKAFLRAAAGLALLLPLAFLAGCGTSSPDETSAGTSGPDETSAGTPGPDETSAATPADRLVPKVAKRIETETESEVILALLESLGSLGDVGAAPSLAVALARTENPLPDEVALEVVRTLRKLQPVAETTPRLKVMYALLQWGNRHEASWEEVAKSIRYIVNRDDKLFDEWGSAEWAQWYNNQVKSQLKRREAAELRRRIVASPVATSMDTRRRRHLLSEAIDVWQEIIDLADPSQRAAVHDEAKQEINELREIIAMGYTATPTPEP